MWRRGGGGIGIVVYIRNSFRASIIHNLSTITDANSQQLWLKVQCRKSKSFLLCAAYRPDSVSMSRFLDDFTASLLWTRFFKEWKLQLLAT